MSKRFTSEFKTVAVKRVTERDHSVEEVAARLGVSEYNHYQWIKRYSVPPVERAVAADQQARRNYFCQKYWL